MLELSLKYRFVTPHTSMVVTKPPGENTQVLNKPKEGEKPPLRRMGISRGGQARGLTLHQQRKLYFNTCALFIVLTVSVSLVHPNLFSPSCSLFPTCRISRYETLLLNSGRAAIYVSELSKALCHHCIIILFQVVNICRLIGRVSLFFIYTMPYIF